MGSPHTTAIPSAIISPITSPIATASSPIIATKKTSPPPPPPPPPPATITNTSTPNPPVSSPEAAEVFDDLGPVDSKTSVESAASNKSRKSISADSRKSVELPDHYFTAHNPELRELYEERAL